MAMPYVVEVLEQCQISPPSNSVPPTSLPLTFFDLFWLPLSSVQFILFYEFHHPKNYFMNTILPNIKHSLSLTLQHFYPLAGNLMWPPESTKPEIVYIDGDSVSFTVAESNYDFYRLSCKDGRDANELYPLLPQLKSMRTNNTTSTLPLFALQVTLFPNKGISIGFNNNHVGCDGNTFYQFLNSWASICRLQGNTSLMIKSPPVYDRTIIKDPNGFGTSYLNQLKMTHSMSRECFNISYDPTPIPVNKIRATFVMSCSDFNRLKEWILNRFETDKQKTLHLSTFVLTCAYVWVCLIKAEWGDNVNDVTQETVHFMFQVDCRGRRLDPPVPATYFGNCVISAVVAANKSDLMGEDGLVIAAQLICKEIQNINDGVWEAIKGLSYYESIVWERSVSVAGSPQLTFYETDFGFGKPRKAEISSIDTSGAISLCECPNEKGAVEIGVVRNKIEMDAFVSLFANTLKALS